MNIKELQRRVCELEDKAGLPIVWQFTDENLKKMMKEIAERYASKIDYLTKHLMLYGAQLVRVLKETDKTTRFIYTLQTKALTEYIETLTGEEVSECFDKWILGEPEDPFLIRLDECAKEIRDVPEGPIPYTRDEMEYFDLEELREIAEGEFDLRGFRGDGERRANDHDPRGSRRSGRRGEKRAPFRPVLN